MNKTRVIARNFCIAVLAALGLTATPAHAGFVQGSMTMAGAFLPTGGDGTNIETATGLDFLGDAFIALQSTGDFEAAGIESFSIGALNDLSFAAAEALPLTLWSINGFEFMLHHIHVAFHGSSDLVIHGQGMVSGNGYTPTNASFSLTANQNGPIYAFSSGITAPEPTSLALLGLGLAAFAAGRRRHRIR